LIYTGLTILLSIKLRIGVRIKAMINPTIIDISISIIEFTAFDIEFALKNIPTTNRHATNVQKIVMPQVICFLPSLNFMSHPA